jgi:DNA-binding CsgD family transcriptional regulator
VLAGRDAQRAALASLLDAARSGTGGSTAVRGVAGSGKSALLADAVDGASGMTVLRTQGVESESPLAFAALQRLLWPVRARIEALPGPQRNALRAAMGEAEGDGDRFLAFLGTLSLLADAAEEKPVLAVVDDAHWLDDASAAALLFVARRLQAERIALVFAVRDGEASGFEADDLPTVVLGGVDGPAAEAVLRARTGGDVAPAVCDELVATTGGNPLALVELAGVLSADQLAGRVPLPTPLPLTGGVERGFLDRCRRLGEPAQRLLLVAAADDTSRLSVILEAAARLDVDDDALDEVERAGLLRVDGEVLSLYHPLVRSAVYRAATSAQRRATHRALADALASSDLDRRAWHLAAAADRPDGSVVTALDGVAERASARGGHEAAAAAWERAAELTSDAAERAGRLSAAAHEAWLAAQPGRSRSLTDAALALVDDPLLRADLDRLRARVEWNVGSPLLGHRILLRAAREVAPFDVERARAMTMLAATVAVFAGDGVEDMTPEATTLGDPDAAAGERGRCYAWLLSGFVHLVHGRLEEAAGQFRSAFAACDPGDDTDLRSTLGVAAFLQGEHKLVLVHHTQLLAAARQSGALVLIVYALTRRASAELATGDWAACAAGGTEALDLAASSGQPTLTRLPLAYLSVLDALRDERDRLADHLDALANRPGGGVTAPIVDDLVRWARALTADSPAAALHQLERMTTGFVCRLAALDRLEAAVRADRPDVARAWADELERWGAALDSDWARAAAAYGRALLGEDAEPQFEQAVKLADATQHRFDRARIHLGYGEHLRRARRRVDARTHLRTALEVFEDLGAGRWATRAAQELRASGETARRRDASTEVELTAQERQVAALVRQGLSNRDVAAQLFVSPRTVDFHLRNVFRKLGVTSRAGLTALALE